MTDLAGFPVEARHGSHATLRVDVLAHGVVRLALARPEARNAFDGRMVQELTAALDELSSWPEARMRVLLLEGEGAVFCAGADLGTMREQAAASSDANLESARGLARMFRALAAFPVPVVCFVRGAAIGGGLGLAACADFVLAEADAVFATSEVRLGLVPAVIGPYVVRRLGLAHAAPLMLTGRRVPAAEALALGLVQRLAEPPATGPALSAVLREFLAAGPGAARATRRLLRRIAPLPDPKLTELTAGTIAAARASAEGQAGLDAFFRHAVPGWVPPAPGPEDPA